jgi:hypothetical protein
MGPTMLTTSPLVSSVSLGVTVSGVELGAAVLISRRRKV